MILMTRKTILGLSGALLLGAVLFFYYGGRKVPPGQPALADITPEKFSTIGTAFDEAKGDVRLLVLLSPT